MYPKTPDALESLGKSAEALLRDVNAWLIRRKESFSIVDDSIVRRTMSVDFDLTGQVDPTHKLASDEDVAYAPLFFLQKGSDDLPSPGAIMVEPEPHFANFDLRDDAGLAMSLPPRSWNAAVSVEAMLSAVRLAGERLERPVPGAHDQFVRRALTVIATSERSEAVRLLQEIIRADPIPEQFQELRFLLAHDETLAWLAGACAVSSIAMVPLIGAEAQQGIVKLAFDQEIDRVALRKLLLAGAGWRGYEVWFDTPYVGAQTYHVEVAAPEGQEVFDAGLIAVAEDGDPQPADHAATLSRVSGFATQVHLYVDAAGRQHGALTWIRLRTRRREFVAVAAAVSMLVTAILWVAYALADEVKNAPAGVPPLLLLLPGLIAAYVGRPGRHPLTTRLLFVARTLLLMVSAAAYVAAAVLALAERKNGRLVDDTFASWWLGLAIFASLCTLMLLIAQALPQPLIRRQKLADSLGIDVYRRARPDHTPWLQRPTDRRWRRWLCRVLTGSEPDPG